MSLDPLGMSATAELAPNTSSDTNVFVYKYKYWDIYKRIEKKTLLLLQQIFLIIFLLIAMQSAHVVDKNDLGAFM